MARGYGDDRNRDRWRDEERERSSYGRDRDEDRGFFERAGDQLRSWFGEEDERGEGRDYRSDPSWNRNQQMRNNPTQSGSSWDRDQNRSQQNRGGISDRDREFGYGRMGRGYEQSNRSWDREQPRNFGPSRGGGSWPSSSDRDRPRMGFGGFRDESDFRGRHHRDHPQSWSEANRGENESLGYGEFRGTLGGFGNQTFGSSEHDHYRNWRDREMSKLDRDYDDYCREREQQFNQDFDSWRRNRQSQSPSASSSSSSSDFGTASNAGVGTTTASMTGTGGSGSAPGSATGTGGSIQSDSTRPTESADAGSPTGGRSGSRSRS